MIIIIRPAVIDGVTAHRITKYHNRLYNKLGVIHTLTGNKN